MLGAATGISKKASFGLDAYVYSAAAAARTEPGRASVIIRFRTDTPMAASNVCASGLHERILAPIIPLYRLVAVSTSDRFP